MHDFVSSVATEERVAVVQKREVVGRGIVHGGEAVADEGGGGRRRRMWLYVMGERVCVCAERDERGR